MATATLTRNATETALAMIREGSPLETLMRYFGDSEAFVCGLIESVTGNDDWRDGTDPADVTEADRRDYENGFWHGQLLVEAELYGEGWAEQNAYAAAETARLVADLPCDPADIPF